jgi:hypothetical protein
MKSDKPNLFELRARAMAAQDYDQRWNNEKPYDGFDFKREYPSKELYVEEWWEDRYLPRVLDEASAELEKIYNIADIMAVQYNALYNTCTALLGRVRASGPPYAMQVATYREWRHAEIMVIEDRVKEQVPEHKPSKIITPEKTLLGPDGKKVN